MINMEVYEIKKVVHVVVEVHAVNIKHRPKININRGATLSIVEVYEVKTGVQRLRKRGAERQKWGVQWRCAEYGWRCAE